MLCVTISIIVNMFHFHEALSFYILSFFTNFSSTSQFPFISFFHRFPLLIKSIIVFGVLCLGNSKSYQQP